MDKHLENNTKDFFFLCATEHVYVSVYSFCIPLSNVLTLPASNVQLTLGFFLLLPPPPFICACERRIKGARIWWE